MFSGVDRHFIAFVTSVDYWLEQEMRPIRLGIPLDGTEPQ